MRRPRFEGICINAFCVLSAAAAIAPGASAQRTARIVTPQAASYVGVWEPVSYHQDLALRDVFFVTASEGWVAGNAGTILHTTDAGTTWTAQLGGDPKSTEPPISMLRFVDAHHGWAVQRIVQGDKLLRTTDGDSWEEIGKLPQGTREYQFVSAAQGFAFAGNSSQSRTIYRTTDGGRSWKQTAECRATLEVEGLTRNTDCWLMTASFPSSTIGYAGGGHPMCGGCGGPPLVMKTQDGGATWTVMMGPGDTHASTIDRMVFLDEQNGFARLAEGKLFATSDGGATWRGLVTAARANLAFADPEVGWAFGTRDLTYTVDGGKHWATRPVVFPSYVVAFSLPRRDRAYVVGDHGMIFRYSIVSEASVPPHAITSPAMPPFDAALDAAMNSLTQGDDALGQRIDAAASGAGAADSNFTQDCCSTQVQAVQSVVDSLPALVASFTAHQRNLNLVLVGYRLATLLPSRVSDVRTAVRQLKQSRSGTTAAAALTGVKVSVDSLREAVRMALMQDPPAFAQDAAMPDAAPAAPALVAAPAAAPAKGADSAKAAAKSDAAKKAAGLLKKKIRIP